jgi:hypothetical protein
MTKLNASLCYLLILGLISSCCKPCDDPNLIQVNRQSNANALDILLEVTNAVRHTNGTATSSISIAQNGDNVTFANVDSVTTSVNLVATDTLRGIKCIKVYGRFGYSCNSGNQGIIFDGIIPEQNQCVNLTNCCLKSQTFPFKNLQQFINCPAGQSARNGGIGLTFVVEDCTGITDTTNISFSTAN